jgi:hypothetical protein
MLDFDVAEDDEVLKVPIRLSEHTAFLSEQDRTKVTMYDLKWIVHEEAENTNTERIAHMEPAESTADEAVIALHKEGAAPAAFSDEMERDGLLVRGDGGGEFRADADPIAEGISTEEVKADEELAMKTKDPTTAKTDVGVKKAPKAFAPPTSDDAETKNEADANSDSSSSADDVSKSSPTNRKRREFVECLNALNQGLPPQSGPVSLRPGSSGRWCSDFGIVARGQTTP